MRKIRSHMIGIDQGTLNLFSDFDTDGEMWTGEGPRERKHHVQFSETYLSPPAVTVGISLWDLDANTNPRMDISAIDITETGFTAVFRTWSDTRVARIRMSWQSIGQVGDPDDAWVL